MSLAQDRADARREASQADAPDEVADREPVRLSRALDDAWDALRATQAHPVDDAPLSDRLEAVATALAGSSLVSLAGVVDVETFIDVLEHAAALAAETEYFTSATGQVAQTDIAPVYAPLVRLLGRAVGGGAR